MRKEEINKKLGKTPCFPNSIYQQLPTLLQEITSQFQTAREKDVLLTSLLGVLSGSTPGISGRYYTLELFPHLYVSIVAPAGSSKSTALFAKEIGKPLHEERKKRGTQEVQPKKWGQFLAANTSAARFLEQLSENGGEAILFESEIDTLTNSFSQEWGNFSSNLREAFQHEAITYSRKTDDINVEINHPKLAMVLTGTPQQIQRLLPSVENGLVSRILFYNYLQELGRISVKPKEIEGGFNAFFKAKGEELKQMAAFLEAHPTNFKLSDEQWNAFDDFLNECIDSAKASHGEEAHSSSLRLGIIMFRIAMILSALRKWEDKNTSSEIYCREEDFSTARELARVYFAHTLIMLEILPQSNTQEHINANEKLLQQLPYKFLRQEAIEVGKELKISDRSIDRALSYFVKAGKLVKHSKGVYEKPTTT